MYYEVLDMPLEELEKLKALRVKMVKANTELVRMLTVRLAPAATIADLLEKVRSHWRAVLGMNGGDVWEQ